jgi:hypothetical protein
MMLSTKVLGEGGIKVSNAATIIIFADVDTWISVAYGITKELRAVCAKRKRIVPKFIIVC